MKQEFNEMEIREILARSLKAEGATDTDVAQMKSVIDLGVKQVLKGVHDVCFVCVGITNWYLANW